ncbi:flagellar protein FlaG [Lysinibacillus sp. HST-98]|uniref:flagellar protein FlaG n=1 Tax=Lysinibacillus TaxID=400634 RepID=UPI0001DA5656|nr:MULTISPECIES: flagellar protein FlaG [Lysinibacillus]EFI69154.1 flagellar protein FlaG [Lysinibacillus fusiformis ZC1]EKU40881.1 flagellar protein FlaG [Lysinibacillus fusiformis ZB2]MBL3730186.1 flagellar protein FlaG [Lysinibacillus sp. HST-98]MCT1541272.1 flagellar protein FlaG [Lysinibacillus capsici]MCT1572456.1 flagellar protein FlaG [Lysinibacillus capsici]
MRISGNADTGAATIQQQVSSNAPAVEKVVTQGSDTTMKSATPIVEQIQQLSNDDETKAKVQEVVDKMNKMLEVNQSAAKFKYHEGLERYYVTVVDSATDEVLKEIPPKKLLDAFYEMQKLFGMIVDEKI